MRELFVSPEIARQLKEKGFRESCMAGLRNEAIYSKVATRQGLDCIISWDKNDDDLPMPLYQQVIDFFREKHNIDITIMPVFREKCGYDSFKRDGYTFEIMRIEPCTLLMWSDYNQCAEDRDEENKEYPKEERCLKPSFKDYYECVNKAIEVALNMI